MDVRAARADRSVGLITLTMAGLGCIHHPPTLKQTQINNTQAPQTSQLCLLPGSPGPSVTGHTARSGQNSKSGTELASERAEIMEITAAVTDTGLCQAQLVGLCDRFVQFAAAMPVRGHYWSGLRCGLATKTRPVKRKELTIDERR